MHNLTPELLQTPSVRSNRDRSLDIAKGIMMLSVVAGHIANFPFGEVYYYYQVAGFFCYRVISFITTSMLTDLVNF